MKNKKISLQYLLISGLAFVLLVFGIQKITHPILWIGFMPNFLIQGFWNLSGETWLAITGIGEIILAILLFFPKKIRFWAALLTSLHLIQIISLVGFSDIGIRDIGLLSIALYLTFSSRPTKQKNKN